MNKRPLWQPILALLLVFLCSVSSLHSGESVSALPTLLELENRYIEANGGLSNIQELKTLVVSGRLLDESGESLDFKLYRKRPSFLRIHLSLGRVQQETVFDGENAYEMVYENGVLRELKVLDAEETEEFTENGGMEGPFFELRGYSNLVRLVGEVEVNGEPAYEIEVFENTKVPYDRIWLDKENGQEVKLRNRAKAGVEQIYETYYSDFTQLDGVWIAKRIEYFIDGERVQKIVIDKIRTNVGIFDSFFSKPASK